MVIVLSVVVGIYLVVKFLSYLDKKNKEPVIGQTERNVVDLYIKESEKHIDSGDFQSSLRKIQMARSIDPNNAIIRSMEAKVEAIISGKNPAKDASTEKAIIMLEIGKHVDLKNYTIALEKLEALNKKYPDDEKIIAIQKLVRKEVRK